MKASHEIEHIFVLKYGLLLVFGRDPLEKWAGRGRLTYKPEGVAWTVQPDALPVLAKEPLFQLF